jgi:hypothetical protein
MHELSLTGFELLQQAGRPPALAHVNLSDPKCGKGSQID